MDPMAIGSFLADIGSGLASWLPALANALVDTFMALFFEVGTDNEPVLNTFGVVSISFFIIGLGFRVLPAVLGWLRAKWTARKGRRRRAR